MTDISVVGVASGRAAEQLIEQAAEIERLQEQLWQEAGNRVEIERLTADNARLRVAIKDCINGRKDWIEKAKAALEPKP